VDFLKELSSKNTTFAPQVWLAQIYEDLQSRQNEPLGLVDPMKLATVAYYMLRSANSPPYPCRA
jgi:hypothetical protein